MMGNISVQRLTMEQKEPEKRKKKKKPRAVREPAKCNDWKPRKRELLEGSHQYGQVLERKDK